MAAETLALRGAQVVLQDHMRSPGRKFLLAGRGGLNLTHSEDLELLLGRYGDASARLEPAIRAFPPAALRAWCEAFGEPVFVGSSGRVFPVAMKASPLLRKWLRRLDALGVEFKPVTRWTGFTEDTTILALGGASWPELGSDASWVPIFEKAGITVSPFVASNARQQIAWSTHIKEKHAGAHVKTVTVEHNGTVVRGDIVISKDGLEGTPIYALSQSLRANPDRPLIIDLKPDLAGSDVAGLLSRQRTKDSFSNRYRKAFGLSPAAIGLMREAKSDDPKRLEFPTRGANDLRRAISSSGGVAWNEIDADYTLIKYPSTMVIGEMIDWDAPTGGYLLQACMAMGRFAALSLAARLKLPEP
jgi:uncharacterized flavoprotein (TIGR03862 family)